MQLRSKSITLDLPLAREAGARHAPQNLMLNLTADQALMLSALHAALVEEGHRLPHVGDAIKHVLDSLGTETVQVSVPLARQLDANHPSPTEITMDLTADQAQTLDRLHKALKLKGAPISAEPADALTFILNQLQ